MRIMKTEARFDHTIRPSKSLIVVCYHLILTMSSRLNSQIKELTDMIKANQEKVKQNKQLPYLVSNVIEVLDLEPETEEDGASVDLSLKTDKCAVIKTTQRETIFLPVIGLVPVDELKPGELVGCNKDSYLILEKLPAEFGIFIHCCTSC